MSPGLRLADGLMRRAVKPVLARTTSVRLARWGLRLAALAFPLPFGLRVLRQRQGWRLCPKAGGNGRVILYFHGGAYVAGSPWTHRGLIGRLALATGAEVVAPAYPLAPEHPAPAGFDAARGAFAALRAEGIPAAAILLAGDSAGAGLAAALGHALSEEGVVIGGMILLSPWVDLTLSGGSIARLAAADALLPAGRLPEVVEQVRGGLAPSDPRLSALFWAAAQAPPALILVGDREILLDDARRLAEVLRGKGARADLQVWPGAPHVFAFLAPWLAEARQAIAAIAGFVATLPLPEARKGGLLGRAARFSSGRPSEE